MQEIERQLKILYITSHFKQKEIIIDILLMVVIMALVIIFACIYFYDSIFDKSRDIEINYLCEIPISLSMDDISIMKNAFPKLKCISVSEYEILLGEILDKSDLSDSEICNIKSSIENIPNDKYIYFSIGKKLEGVFYSEQSGCYGYNGIYSTKEYDAIFIYWSDEPLGNMIDGYI